MRSLIVTAPLFLSCFWAACSSSDPSPSAPSPTAEAGVPEEDTGSPDPPDAAPASEWKACAKSAGNPIECKTFKMPLDWSQPNGKTIDVVVRRRLAAKPPSTVSFWTLPGGPGQSSAGIVDFHLLSEMVNKFDVYSIDFRGSGDSTPFECPGLEKVVGWAEPADVPMMAACGAKLKEKWGDDLKHFSTTNAARDLAEAMRKTEQPGRHRVVVGTSFGGLTAQRLLQVAPEVVDAVMLNSSISSTRSTIDLGVSFDVVAKTVLETCAQRDTYCAEKLGPEPAKLVGDLAAKIATGHCKTSRNLTARQYRRFLAQTLIAEQDAIFPALLYRINRCDPADEAPILKVLDRVMPFFDDAGNAVNVGLFLHIVMSELMLENEPTAEALAAMEDASLTSSHESPTLRQLLSQWPVAPRDPLTGKYATTDKPILILSGTFDARALPSESLELGEKFHGANQVLVKLAGRGHSPFPGEGCASAAGMSFINFPSRPIENPCINTMPVNFRGTPSTANKFFGTADYWDN